MAAADHCVEPPSGNDREDPPANDLFAQPQGGKEMDVARALVLLGNMALNEGNNTAAWGLYTEAELLAREVNSDRYMIIPLVGRAGLALARGRSERAVRLSGTVEVLRSSIGSRLAQEERVKHERTPLQDDPVGR